MNRTKKKGFWARVISSGGKKIANLPRALFFIAGSHACGVVISFLSVRALTGYLTPEDYGKLSLITTTASIFGVFVLGPIANAAARYYASAKEGCELEYFSLALKKLIQASLVTILIIQLIVCFGLKLWMRQWDYCYLSWLVFPQAVMIGLMSIFDALQNAANKRGVAAIHQVLLQAAKIIFPLLVLSHTGSSVVAVLVGQLIGVAMILVSSGYFTYLRGSSTLCVDSPSKDWFECLKSYSFSHLNWSAITWVYAVSDRWSLSLFTSTSEMGKYAAFYQLGYVPTALLGNVITQFASPMIFAAAGDGRQTQGLESARRIVVKYMSLYFCLMFLWGLFLVGLHDTYASLLLAPPYRGDSIKLVLFSLAGASFTTGQIGATYLQCFSSLRKLSQVKVFTAIFGIALHFICGKYRGSIGVLIALNISSIIYGLWILKYLAKNNSKFLAFPPPSI